MYIYIYIYMYSSTSIFRSSARFSFPVSAAGGPCTR